MSYILIFSLLYGVLQVYHQLFVKFLKKLLLVHGFELACIDAKPHTLGWFFSYDRVNVIQQLFKAQLADWLHKFLKMGLHVPSQVFDNLNWVDLDFQRVCIYYLVLHITHPLKTPVCNKVNFPLLLYRLILIILTNLHIDILICISEYLRKYYLYYRQKLLFQT